MIIIGVDPAGSRRGRIMLQRTGSVTIRFTVTSRRASVATMTATLQSRAALASIALALGRAGFPGMTIFPPTVGATVQIPPGPTASPVQTVGFNMVYLAMLSLILVPCCCGIYVCCYWNWLCEKPNTERNRNPKFRFPLPRQQQNRDYNEDYHDVYESGGGDFIRENDMFKHQKCEAKT